MYTSLFIRLAPSPHLFCVAKIICVLGCELDLESWIQCGPWSRADHIRLYIFKIVVFAIPDNSVAQNTGQFFIHVASRSFGKESNVSISQWNRIYSLLPVLPVGMTIVWSAMPTLLWLQNEAHIFFSANFEYLIASQVDLSFLKSPRLLACHLFNISLLELPGLPFPFRLILYFLGARESSDNGSTNCWRVKCSV